MTILVIGLLAVSLCAMAFSLVVFLQMRSLVAQSQRLLASRNFTEFSLGEARVAEATVARKPGEDVGYDTAWGEE